MLHSKNTGPLFLSMNMMAANRSRKVKGKMRQKTLK